MAMLPEQSRCGWALTASGAPWVAQRVWPMPEVKPVGAAQALLFAGPRPIRCPEAVRARQVSPGAHQGDPGRVVAAILQAREALEQCRQRVVGSNDPDNAAHEASLLGPFLASSGVDYERKKFWSRCENSLTNVIVERLDHHAHHRFGARRTDEQVARRRSRRRNPVANLFEHRAAPRRRRSRRARR